MDNTGQNMTVRQLADQLGITKQTVQNRADALGIVFAMQGNKRIVTPEQAEQIREDMQTQHQAHQEKPKRGRSSRSKADTDTGTTDATDSKTVELLRDQLRHQAEEIQFLRSLVVSLQNEKSALLQLAAPTDAPQADREAADLADDAPAADTSAADLPTSPGATVPDDTTAQDTAADLPLDPEPTPTTDQEPADAAPAAKVDPEPSTLWDKIKSFFRG